jgi:hypothetical protein
MKKLIRLLWTLGLLLIAIIFQMCDYSGDETESINNQSDSLIIVKFKATENEDYTGIIGNKTLRIPPKTDTTIYVTQRGVNQLAFDGYKDTIEMFSYIKIAKIQGNDTINSSNNYRGHNIGFILRFRNGVLYTS